MGTEHNRTPQSEVTAVSLSPRLQENPLFRRKSSNVPASCETEFLPPLCLASLLGEQLAFSSPGVVIQRGFFQWESQFKPGSFLPALPSCSCSFITARSPLDCADAAVSGLCCKLDHRNKSEFLCAYVYISVHEQLFFL